MRDLSNNLHFVPAFAPKAAVDDDTPQVSTILDTLGATGVVLALVTGQLAGGPATFTTLIEESDAENMAEANAVSDADLIGTEALASFATADSNKARKIGIVNHKRYLRATITPSGNAGSPTGQLYVAGMWVTKPLDRPTPNPPQ